MVRRLLVSALLLFSVLRTVQAQNGRFEVRFVVKSIDCVLAKATVAVQVRASHADSTFLMKDANFRFSYDPRLISNPQLVSQDNFSGSLPASDSGYLPQDLKGSTATASKGVVSLNVGYNAPVSTASANVAQGPKRVGTDWMNVASISFSIVNTQIVQSNCFELIWNKDTDSPATVVNEVFPATNGAYNDKAVTPGKFFGTQQVCLRQYCSIDAINDSFLTSQNAPVSGNVLPNDIGVSIVMNTTPVTQPKNGSITLNRDGTFTYIPKRDFFGRDSLQYRACLQVNSSVCDVAWMYILIKGPPVADLSLTKSVSNARPAIGETISYSLVVSNTGDTVATNVEVTDMLPAGVQYISSSGQGAYDASSGRWVVGTVPAGGKSVLIINVKVVLEGTWFNKAEISKVDQPDPDSTPANDKMSEDDIGMACFAVPIRMCQGDEYELTLPSGYTTIQWYRDGVPIAQANQSTLTISQTGTYTFTAFNLTCPVQGCCPAIFEASKECCKTDVCVPVTVRKTKSIFK